MTPCFNFSTSSSKQILSFTEHSNPCYSIFCQKISYFRFHIILYLVLILPPAPYPCVFLSFPSATLHILTPRSVQLSIYFASSLKFPILVELLLMTTLHNNLALLNMYFSHLDAAVSIGYQSFYDP